MKVVVVEDRLDEVQKKAPDELRSGVIDMAAGMQAAAQSVAPVDTGYMRSHIMLHTTRYPEVTIESEADYSGYVEFGTRYMSAQPFMRPAYEQSRLPSIQRLEDRIANALSR